MIRRLRAILIGTTILALVSVGLYFGVKAAYGSYKPVYYVTADFDRVGQQVLPNMDVRVRGVIIGKVSDIELVDRRARLTLKIDEPHEVPADAEAVITLKTFLGSKFLDLRFDPNGSGPMLEEGDHIATTRVAPDLEDALDDGTKVLDAIEPDELATVINELATASRGRGDDIARGLDANAELSGVFARNTENQIKALRDFDVLFAALDPKAQDLNALAGAVNEGAPVYASQDAQAAMSRALSGLVSFSDDLGDILITQRGELRTMYRTGDVVLQTLVNNRAGLHDLVHGLYRYVYKLGGDISRNMLFDGSAGAGFVNFIGGNDQEEEFAQICSGLPPEVREEVPFCEDVTQ